MGTMSWWDPFLGIFQIFFEAQVQKPFVLEAQSSTSFETRIKDQICLYYVANKN